MKEREHRTRDNLALALELAVKVAQGFVAAKARRADRRPIADVEVRYE